MPRTKKSEKSESTTKKKAPAKRAKAATDEAAELLERVEDSLELDTWLQATDADAESLIAHEVGIHRIVWMLPVFGLRRGVARDRHRHAASTHARHHSGAELRARAIPALQGSPGMRRDGAHSPQDQRAGARCGKSKATVIRHGLLEFDEDETPEAWAYSGGAVHWVSALFGSPVPMTLAVESPAVVRPRAASGGVTPSMASGLLFTKGVAVALAGASHVSRWCDFRHCEAAAWRKRLAGKGFV